MNEDIKETIRAFKLATMFPFRKLKISRKNVKILSNYIENIEEQNTELKEDNFKLQARSDRIINNWNKLREWLEEEITTIKNNFSQVNGNYFMMNDRIEVLEDALDKMQEIEKGGINE